MKSFFSAWIAGGLLLFYFGPVEWSGASTPSVALYVSLCWGLFLVGAAMASRSKGTPTPVAWQPRSRKMALIVMSVNAALTLFYVASTTGRSAFRAEDYSGDLGAVYADYAEYSSSLELSGIEQLVILAKAPLFPVALLVFIQYFRRDRLIVALFVVPLVISSLFRGTDKEIADLLILVGVAAYLHGMLTWRRVVLGMTAVVGALSLFFFRRIGRFEGDAPTCLPGSETCFNYDSFIAQELGKSAEMLVIFLTHYVTNGYQGLSHAFGLQWTPNWGVGHLPPVKSSMCGWLNQGCSTGDYQDSLTASGWDAGNRWTSVYPVLANDLSFWLVPLFMLLLGVVYARSMNMWRSSKDPAAGATIAVVAMFVAYSSANMQIAISLEWAFATVVFLYVTPWRRSRSDPGSVGEGVPRQGAQGGGRDGPRKVGATGETGDR